MERVASGGVKQDAHAPQAVVHSAPRCCYPESGAEKLANQSVASFRAADAEEPVRAISWRSREAATPQGQARARNKTKEGFAKLRSFPGWCAYAGNVGGFVVSVFLCGVCLSVWPCVTGRQRGTP